MTEPVQTSPASPAPGGTDGQGPGPATPTAEHSLPAPARRLGSGILTGVGGVAMLVGALDPLEGSLIILPGSGLMALGAYLRPGGRHWVTWRLWSFLLIVFGVSAMFGLSAGGGFGGNSGRSMWWGVLTLPYLVGWSLGIWGPGSPRWVSVLGIPAGSWYLVLLGMVLKASQGRQPHPPLSPVVILAAFGVITIIGCIVRLGRRSWDPTPALPAGNPRA